jgi:hypothetical protein
LDRGQGIPEAALDSHLTRLKLRAKMNATGSTAVELRSTWTGEGARPSTPIPDTKAKAASFWLAADG